jgi:hypothetical protein
MAEVDPGVGVMPFAVNAFSSGKVKGVKVNPIGTLDDFLQIYTTVKQVQRLIDFKANYIVKDGYFIASRNEEAKKKVEEFFRLIPVEERIKIWAKNAMIYGNGYLEYTGNNLIPRDSRKMVIYIDEEGHGEIVQYRQEVGNNEEDYPVFEPEEILLYKNNAIDHLRGVSEFVGYRDIINLDDAVMIDLAATIHRQAYPRTKWTVGTEDRPVAIESDKFTAAQELINNLQPGEDVITNGELSVEEIGGKQAGSDFKDYLDLVNQRICMQAGVPSDLWFGGSSGETINMRRQIFEESEIMPRRREIEDIINRELIPQLVSINEDEPVYFRFGDINTEQAFIKAKIDLTHLQTSAKTPNELRAEKGMDPIEGGDVPTGQQQQIPISSKDSTAKKSIGGNLTGARPSNG